MTGSFVPDEVLALVAERVGRPRPESLERLGAARVFGVEVEARGRTRAIVIKRFESPRLFAQARHALGVWFAGQGELGGAQVPTLLAADASLLTLVCTRLPGTQPGESAPELASIHRAAGRCLGALHRLSVVDDDPLPLAEALVARQRGWQRACAAALDPRERRVVAELAPRVELFAGAKRVPCHRDFTPGNWLWGPLGLGIVDFEHARLDLGLSDLAKLAVGSWAHRPALEIAFFEGYGRPLSPAEHTQLRSVIVLHGVASLAWGLRHSEPGFVAEGRRALALADAWPRGG